MIKYLTVFFLITSNLIYSQSNIIRGYTSSTKILFLKPIHNTLKFDNIELLNDGTFVYSINKDDIFTTTELKGNYIIDRNKLVLIFNNKHKRKFKILKKTILENDKEYSFYILKEKKFSSFIFCKVFY